MKSPPLGYLAVGHPLYYETDYCPARSASAPPRSSAGDASPTGSHDDPRRAGFGAELLGGVGRELSALTGLWWQAGGLTLLASGQRHVASLVRDPYTPRIASRITLMTKSGWESIGTWLLSMS